MTKAAKTIGTSLEARVVLETPDAESLTFLRSFGDGLHFLFITSAVEFGTVSAGAFRSESIPGFAVDVHVDRTNIIRLLIRPDDVPCELTSSIVLVPRSDHVSKSTSRRVDVSILKDTCHVR